MAYMIVRKQGFHIFQTIGSKMAVRLSACPHFTPPEIFSGTNFCYRLSKPQGHVAAGRLGKLKKSVTSSGKEAANFQLVA
jgi:hypothetical protein